MKKSVGIGVGIVIVAILIIFAFSNIDDLVSTNFQETSSQISETIEETISEVKFTNPLQTYEVDSKCELAYVIRNNIEYHNGFPFKSDQEYIENVIKVEFEKKSKEMLEETGDAMRLNPELMKQKNLELFDEMHQEIVDHTMEYNSIHPKLRDSVESVLFYTSVPLETHQEKIKLLDTMYLIELQSYQEDLECGKQFHEHFGDETFQTLKAVFGSEELAMKRYNEIKEVISDVPVITPFEVYDPEGRMLSKEQCVDLVTKRDELKKEIDDHVEKINFLRNEYRSNPDLIDIKEEMDELSNDPHFKKIAREHDELNKQWGIGCAPFEKFR